jgi:hypothetical protein
MDLMFTAIWAKLFEFQTFRRGLLVLHIAVVPVLAFLTLERDDFSCHFAPSGPALSPSYFS